MLTLPLDVAIAGIGITVVIYLLSLLFLQRPLWALVLPRSVLALFRAGGAIAAGSCHCGCLRCCVVLCFVFVGAAVVCFCAVAGDIGAASVGVLWFVGDALVTLVVVETV